MIMMRDKERKEITIDTATEQKTKKGNTGKSNGERYVHVRYTEINSAAFNTTRQRYNKCTCTNAISKSR